MKCRSGPGTGRRVITALSWHRARKVRLDSWTVARKSHATHAYASQLDGEPAIGLAPMLPRVLLERMRLPYEIVFV